MDDLATIRERHTEAARAPGDGGWRLSYALDVDRLLDDVERLGVLVADLREKNRDLNRRCQKAESAARQTVEACKRSGESLGRGLARWVHIDPERLARLMREPGPVEEFTRRLGCKHAKGAGDAMRVRHVYNGGEYEVIFDGGVSHYFLRDPHGAEVAIRKDVFTPVRAFKRGDPVLDHEGMRWLVWGYGSDGKVELLQPGASAYLSEHKLRLDTSEGEG